ncbi:ADP-glyceromanno-heptose 6-epimerase [Candidatus Pelagibacter sp. Uisw_094]|uniref:ADP-glyceromanno-heptose 6-epimerase n=1 Tax=Candidatus Pelagibacter sp. Uisw_094 TaxID=3230980 RepID=UPI0039E9723C|tara:strand:+ start:11 stop:952 length:942 start_codon:yes stop_codon:yes gene_type:complete
MIICTGGSGFIGSNLIRELNKKKIRNILIVDQKLKKPPKDLKYKSFISREDFLKKINNSNFLSKIKFVYHLGANSSTSGKDINDYMVNNFLFSKKLIEKCIKHKIKIIYASSASVYGTKTKNFKESTYPLYPENFYAISKAMVDYYVLGILNKIPSSKIIGLRYFNVYGPGESQKKNMASVMYNFCKQIKKNNIIKLFKGSDGFEDGEQKRDFVHIDDCIKVNLWLTKNFKSGIYNVGTGKAESFNRVANLIKKFLGNNKTKIKYVKISKDIADNYQSYTQANIIEIRKSGYNKNFIGIQDGVISYVKKLSKK